MKRNNPTVIPRNYIVESVLKEASENDNLEPLKELLNAESTPYSDEVLEYYKKGPEYVDTNYKTYCGI